MTTNDEPSSSALYEQLREHAGHPKSIKALEHIRNACDYLDQHHIPISTAEVARLCRSTGPRAQSIHNSKGFLAYLKARIAEQQIPFKPNSATCHYSTADPQAQAIIYALETSLRLKKSSVENMKRALQNAGEFDIDATIRTGRLVRFRADIGSHPNESFVLIAKRLLDADHLKRFGLLLERERIIAPERNGRVFVNIPQQSWGLYGVSRSKRLVWGR